MTFLLRFGDFLFRHTYWLYLPMYSAYKAMSDRKERAILRSILAPGMVAVDVGANVGIYTKFLARQVGEKGAVFAFEPSRLNFDRLLDNVRHLNVTTVEAAVGEKSGSAKLYLSESANIDHRMYDSGDDRSVVEVKLFSLDDYFPAGSRVDFIKVDVQGHELSVLNGARRVFLDNPQISCLIEFWPFGLSKAGVSPSDLLVLIAKLGFSYRIVGGSEDAVARPEQNIDLEFAYSNLIISRAK